MSLVQAIPKSLIYEMDGDTPIYYAGYREVLIGNKNIDDIMGASGLQSFLVTDITGLLLQAIGRAYRIGASELGLQLEKGYRSADIAIFERSQLKSLPTLKKYIPTPPKVVIEVDIKADQSEAVDPTGYFHRKTDQLLAHGVEQVIWIFTETQKVTIARPDRPWLTISWTEPFEVLGVSIDVASIVEEMI